MNGRTAVFLDRDGVIIEEVNYLSHPDQIRLIPGSAGAISRLNNLQIPVVVVSNQAGVARGYFSESAIAPIHERLQALLARESARLDAIYYCPHHPEGSVPEYSIRCTCRKPQPGMLLYAAKSLNVALPTSWLIGNNISDIQAGLSSGCRTILVETGHGKQFSSKIPIGTVLRKDLEAAVGCFLHEIRMPYSRSA